MGTVWTERGPGQSVSCTEPNEDGSVELIIDSSLSPDWLRLPEELGAPLGGVNARVLKSLWFPLGPNMDVETLKQEPWVYKQTRWHLVRPVDHWESEHPLAVAEVDGVGWVLVDIGPNRADVMLNWEENQ